MSKITKYNSYDVFVSYHKYQQFQVDRVCKELKKFNLRIWYDQDLMEDRYNDFDESLNALQNSMLFVCFTSKNYIKNIKCRTEFSIAVEQEISIINLKLENIDYNEFIKSYELKNLIYNEINFYEYTQLDDNLTPDQSAVFRIEDDEFVSIVNLMKELIEFSKSNKHRLSFKNSVSNYYNSLKE
jgi:hypothetical protein